MIEPAFFGLLLLLGGMALLLALLGAVQGRRTQVGWARAGADSASAAEVDVPPPEIESFRRSVEDHAPAMLQHLVRCRRQLGPGGLKVLIDAFSETPGMEVRKRVLSCFARIYAAPTPNEEELGDLIGELRRVGHDQRSEELYQELERVSPAQLALLRLLNDLFEASDVRVMKWRKHFGRLKKTMPTITAGEDIDHHFADLMTTVRQLVDGLSTKLPQDGTTDKRQRRKMLGEGLDLVARQIETYLGETPPWVRSLPEGMLVEACFRKLWSSMNELRTKSGGESRDLPQGFDATQSSEPASGPRVRPFGLATVSMFLLAILFFAGAWFVRFGRLPHRFDAAKTIESTVNVESSTGAGSGFLIRRHRLIVTNHHVVDSDVQVVVNVKRRGDPYGSPRTLKAAVLATDRENDVAILTIAEEVEFAALPVGLEMARGTPLTTGQTVHVVGSPLGMKDLYVEGKVSKVEPGLAWIDATIAPGNSGGPVCDTRGVVVGIMTAKKNAENFSLGIAIPPTAAWRLIDALVVEETAGP